MGVSADPQPLAVHHGQGVVRGARMPQVSRWDAIEALAVGVRPCFIRRREGGFRVG
ncbi:hypothetical protein [Streptomyces sp. 769]|uniref:hypothetical protein n=1 Tax=Streptomyces sp. 769 TaxID=1262452 RepID=UPI0005821F2B|nr:hypothetical protein [Streptomyces sp. 769]AJC52771.1 hypothetical protein GZL_00163 [Streptomyces sp. 769]